MGTMGVEAESDLEKVSVTGDTPHPHGIGRLYMAVFGTTLKLVLA
jgi:hypothetical protein